jgi:hypothetical protein
LLSLWDNNVKQRFMQDGAPPHFALAVLAWLDNHCTGQWTGLRGPTEWPPRSPFLAPYVLRWWDWTKKKKSTDQNQEHLTNCNNKFEILLPLLVLSFCRKVMM